MYGALISFLRIATHYFYQPKWKQPCLSDDRHWWRPHRNWKSLQNLFDKMAAFFLV